MIRNVILCGFLFFAALGLSTAACAQHADRGVTTDQINSAIQFGMDFAELTKKQDLYNMPVEQKGCIIHQLVNVSENGSKRTTYKDVEVTSPRCMALKQRILVLTTEMNGIVMRWNHEDLSNSERRINNLANNFDGEKGGLDMDVLVHEREELEGIQASIKRLSVSMNTTFVAALSEKKDALLSRVNNLIAAVVEALKGDLPGGEGL